MRGDKDDCQNYRPFPINNKVTTTLLKRDVSDFQLSDKALDLVKDPNGGNVTIPPLEGQLTRGTSGGDEGPLTLIPGEEKFSVSFLVKFRRSGAAELNQKRARRAGNGFLQTTNLTS